MLKTMEMQQPATPAEWVAAAINLFNRISILSEHPVRPRGADGKILFDLHDAQFVFAALCLDWEKDSPLLSNCRP